MSEILNKMKNIFAYKDAQRVNELLEHNEKLEEELKTVKLKLQASMEHNRQLEARLQLITTRIKEICHNCGIDTFSETL